MEASNPYSSTWASISAQNVADVGEAASHWQYTREFIWERNRLNVLFVANDSQRHLDLLCTADFTVEAVRSTLESGCIFVASVESVSYIRVACATI